jgi:hopanoid biosynthesis associated RND transporter like protein HpnN
LEKSFQKISERLLTVVLRVTLRKPGLTILIGLLLAVGSWVYTISNLEFLTGQLDLISPKERLVQLTQEYEQFDRKDNFIVAIQGKTQEQAIAFVNSLAAELNKEPQYYKELFYRLDPAHLRRWALLYLDKEDLTSLIDSLNENVQFIHDLAASPKLNTVFELINRQMTSKMMGKLFTGFLESEPKPEGKEQAPYDLTFLIRLLTALQENLAGESPRPVSWWEFFGTGWGSVESKGYFWTEEKRYLLLFVTPVSLPNEFNEAGASLEHLRAMVNRVQAAFPGLQAGVTGQKALNTDEMGVALSDMEIATILSLVGLTLLLIAFWRNLRRPLQGMGELILALSLTFGLTTLVVGHLNILSIVFAPLILGIGIDYGIHWFARFEEELGKNGTKFLDAAIYSTHLELGPGIILAGFTATLSFLPLVLTGFRGLVELGIITGMGMIMTTMTTICVLPALTLFFGRILPPFKKRELVHRRVFKMSRLASRTILAVSGVGMAVSIVAVRGIGFDLNILRMQPPDTQSVVWEHKLIADSRRSALSASVVVHSKEELVKKQKELEALPTVSEVISMLSFIPKDQEEKLELLKRLAPIAPYLESVRYQGNSTDKKHLDQTLSSIHFKMRDAAEWGEARPLMEQMNQVAVLIRRIRALIRSEDQVRLDERLAAFEKRLLNDISDNLTLIGENIHSRPMRIEDLPPQLLERYVGTGPSYLIKIYPQGDIWETEPLGKFVRDVQSVDADALGDAVTIYVFTRAFQSACIKAAVYAVLAIFFLLLISTRSIKDTFLAVIPLAVGTVWTLGLMWVFGVNFNLANSLFLPLIVGAGVEYGIIVIVRWRTSVLGGLPVSAAKGVSLAALTTLVGFGTLMISSHRGIYSLGLLAAIGSLCTLCAATLVLPAVLNELNSGREGKTDWGSS